MSGALPNLCESNNSPVYVYQLSFEQRKKLCAVLDVNSSWQQLAAKMKYDANDVLQFRQVAQNGRSPTEILLDVWGSKLPTVDKLAVLLAEINNRPAVDTLISLIADKTKRKIEGILAENHRRLQQAQAERQQNHLLLHEADNEKKQNNNRIAVVGAAAASVDKAAPVGGNKLCSPSGDDNNNNAKNNYRSNEPQSPQQHLKKTNACSIDPLIAISLHNTLRITYKDLCESTDEFCADNVIGYGGYGVVYKGWWKHTKVAIKRFGVTKSSDGQFRKKSSSSAVVEGFKQSVAELKTLAMCRHDNIVALYGYCFEEPEYCIVYQFMPGGSLDDKLFFRNPQQQPLNWAMRLKIGRGAICGLNYLHTCSREPLIHGDIKPANILLDACLEPKIGDFGLCRRGLAESATGSPMIASHIKGTLAYLPPEFTRSKLLTTKLDIYSFGVVLFEVATGLRAYSDFRKPSSLVEYLKEKRQDNINNNDKGSESIIGSSFANLKTLSDKKIAHITDDRKEIFWKFIKLGFACTIVNHEKRPTASFLIDELDNNG